MQCPQRPATVFCDAARPVQGYPSHRMEASAEGAAWQPVRPGDGSSWSGQGTAPGRKDVQSSCVGCAGEAFSVASMARDTGAAALRRFGLHGNFGTGIPRYAVCENLPGGAPDRRVLAGFLSGRIGGSCRGIPVGIPSGVRFQGRHLSREDPLPAQATPTCFLLDSRGRLVFKTIGLYPGKVEEYLSAKDR